MIRTEYGWGGLSALVYMIKTRQILPLSERMKGLWEKILLAAKQSLGISLINLLCPHHHQQQSQHRSTGTGPHWGQKAKIRVARVEEELRKVRGIHTLNMASCDGGVWTQALIQDDLSISKMGTLRPLDGRVICLLEVIWPVGRGQLGGHGLPAHCSNILTRWFILQVYVTASSMSAGAGHWGPQRSQAYPSSQVLSVQ
jgi:hypothetical protein